MPLWKSSSEEAFRKNVGAEMAAGKPQKQALAIAFDVKRRAGGHAKRKKRGIPDRYEKGKGEGA